MYTTEMIVSKMDHDDKKDDAASEEILDTNWDAGPMGEARRNLNLFCSGLLLQKSLRILVDEILVLEAILEDDSISIVDKVSSRQTLTILNTTWSALTEDLGFEC